MAFINKIFKKSSQHMVELPNNSVDLIVTSPPYNIKINYGNKWHKRKIVDSKSIKYKDNLSENNYKNLIKKVASECKRVLKKEGTVFFNMKNRLIDDQI